MVPVLTVGSAIVFVLEIKKEIRVLTIPVVLNCSIIV